MNLSDAIVTCEVAEEALTALMDGELSTKDAAALEAHLAACQRCTSLRDAYASMLSAASTFPVPERDVSRAVSAAIAAEDGGTAAILTELRGLRETVDAMRGEIADLRRQLATVRRSAAAPPVVRRPATAAPLFLFTSTTDRFGRDA